MTITRRRVTSAADMKALAHPVRWDVLELLLMNGAKALECYDQALSLGPNSEIEENRAHALVLLHRDTDRTEARPAKEELVGLSKPEPVAEGRRAWLLVQWTALVKRLRAWFLRL